MATAERGRWGEELAARYLRRRFYRIVETNYRCRMGEIDLIAENRRFLVFVEVKLRKNANFAEAMEFVDVHKQNRLRKTAMLYLSQHETEKQCRFDVIEIYAPDDEKKPRIRHLEDAFQ
ncbi:MAG: YraN family protein [Ruminococcaceae bacterium]|nr:YraN family protein [Oscillospiraceae bacterium]